MNDPWITPPRMKIGDKVRLREGHGYTTTTIAVLVRPVHDAPGGWYLDPPLDSIRYWNEDELELVESV